MNLQSSSTFSDSDRVKVICAIRDGILATRHHVRFTGRVIDAIKKRLGDTFVVSAMANTPGDERISVWGDSCHFYNRIYVYGNSAMEYRHNPLGVPHWADALLKGLQVEDTSDYVERAQAEAANVDLHSHLAAANTKIANLLHEIQAERDIANKLIAAQPVPSCATVRADRKFWLNPSAATRAKYPNVFDKVVI